MLHETEWYRLTESDALRVQKSALEHGIGHDEVIRRQTAFGQNTLSEAAKKSAWKILLAQFSDFLVLVLIAAAIIASFLGEPQDAVAIVAIIILNAALGFFQEFRAEKAIEALKSLSAPQAKVRRMGNVLVLPAYEIVPGDIVLLESGNIVPADLRILESFQLKVNESMLTGESEPIEKMSRSISSTALALPDQRNMAFKGTVVSTGRATGLVVRTGMSTELGRIANLLNQEIETKTPLQDRLATFAKRLAIVVICLCAVIFVAGLIRGEEPILMFLTALSLAVAGIPEALPAVVTISLALGARKMIQKKALIRKLPAVEALGSVTVICTDKTGTLTENRMTVQGFYVKNNYFSEVSSIDLSKSSWSRLFEILALNNDVSVSEKNVLQGDPTETALVQSAMDYGFQKRNIESAMPRIAEVSFSSERQMMTTVHKTSKCGLVLVKGAPEKVLPLCKLQLFDDDIRAFELKSQLQAVDEFAKKGYRVLALAYRETELNPTNISMSEFEKDLVFVGLVGLMDPPRPEVKEAIHACHSAGIRVVMITGDHPATAYNIGKELGIIKKAEDRSLMTGANLQKLSDQELKNRISELLVFARVAPEQKIRIVKALQSMGETVAMTGDGVNDAPALKSADVGVSMGKGGTDVAREASHIILLDDNFASIVTSVKEGRRIYDNIRKFVRFALSGNSGEIWVLFMAPFFGLPIPLLPIHILWVNLVTDGLPGLALALEPEEKNIMIRGPRPRKESIFARGLWQHAVWVGLLTSAATLSVLAWAHRTGHAHWQSMAFTVLTFTQMGHVMAIRSETESLIHQGLRSNRILTATVLLTLILQICTLYVPILNKIFKTEPLTISELMICFAVSSSVFIAVEIEKWVRRKRT